MKLKTAYKKFNSTNGGSVLSGLLRILKLLVLLYLFLFAVGLLGTGFKSLGKKFAETLVYSTANPLVGLFIGILVTSIIQSSSTTTSVIVGMVASGVLTVQNAIPMIMGANVGTTVTATLVSLGSLSRRGEFERAFAAATMHDFFNLIALGIFFPLELLFHPFEKGALVLTKILTGVSGGEFHSPLKALIKPSVTLVQNFVQHTLSIPFPWDGIVMVLVSLGFIFFALLMLVRYLRMLMANSIESTIDKFIGRRGLLGILIGFLITGIVQSSSVTTSIVVPLVAAQVMALESGFTIVLGANLGTTLTALIASLAGGPAGLTIALVHFLFNLSGIILIYPLPRLRRVPISMARSMARLSARSRIYPIVFVIIVFFLLPSLAIIIDKIFR